MSDHHSYIRPILLYLIVFLSGLFLNCGTPDTKTCGSLWVSCPDLTADTLICSNCELLDKALNDTILYFRFRDCQTDKTFQSSVGSDCTLEIK